MRKKIVVFKKIFQMNYKIFCNPQNQNTSLFLDCNLVDQ